MRDIHSDRLSTTRHLHIWTVHFVCVCVLSHVGLSLEVCLLLGQCGVSSNQDGWRLQNYFVFAGRYTETWAVKASQCHAHEPRRPAFRHRSFSEQDCRCWVIRLKVLDRDYFSILFRLVKLGKPFLEELQSAAGPCGWMTKKASP